MIRMSTMWVPWHRLGGTHVRGKAWTVTAALSGILCIILFMLFDEDAVVCSKQVHLYSNSSTGGRSDEKCMGDLRDATQSLQKTHDSEYSVLGGIVDTFIVALLLAISIAGVLLLFWSIPSTEYDSMVRSDSTL